MNSGSHSWWSCTSEDTSNSDGFLFLIYYQKEASQKAEIIRSIDNDQHHLFMSLTSLEKSKAWSKYALELFFTFEKILVCLAKVLF